MSDDLRHEQQFLLRSLRDLDNERAAGDIDDADYAALRDGYISRTAAITRELGVLKLQRQQNTAVGCVEFL